MKKFKDEYKKETLILPIILVIIWYLICDLFQLVPSYIFPGPIDVATSFVKLTASGKLFMDIFETLYKVLFGMLLASTVGITLGIILGWYKRLETLCKLVISILRLILPMDSFFNNMVWYGNRTCSIHNFHGMCLPNTDFNN